MLDTAEGSGEAYRFRVTPEQVDAFDNGIVELCSQPRTLRLGPPNGLDELLGGGFGDQ